MFALSESDLPEQVTNDLAVQNAYPRELADVADHLRRGNSCLIECDKDLVTFAFLCVRDRLRQLGLSCSYLDGRPRPDAPATATNPGLIANVLMQLRDAVRSTREHRVLVIPYLDLLTGSATGLSPEAREVIPLLHENPNLVALGFRDPCLPLPRPVETIFPQRLTLLGVRRDSLKQIVSRSEGRKFGRPINLARVHTLVSGLNAVRLRRVLAAVDGEDHPPDPTKALDQLRRATLTGGLTVPATRFADIGGYQRIKDRLHDEILSIVQARERATSADELDRLDGLLPRGVLFSGPGTGKRLFAEALAHAMNAALLPTSGAELKSKTHGGSEENLRLVFYRARQSAPAVILFDDLDTFASNRPGTDTVTVIEQSMFHQLLSEMDRLPREELVIVAATTNHAERLDGALLRPGRFELHLSIPHPDADDRRAILRLYDERLFLHLAADAVERAVEQTGNGKYSAAHLSALARGLARMRLRSERTDETTPADVDAALAALPELA